VEGKRVTIIIEDDEKVQTILVPSADAVEFDISYEESTSHDFLYSEPAVIDIISFNFHPVPDEDGITHFIKEEDAR